MAAYAYLTIFHVMSDVGWVCTRKRRRVRVVDASRETLDSRMRRMTCEGKVG